MEQKDIVIVALAVIVLLLAGYLLGQRRRHTNTLDTSEPSVRVHAAAPSSRDYSKQLLEAKTFHQREAMMFSAWSENRILTSFNHGWPQIEEANVRYNTEKNEHTRNEILSFYSEIIEATNFGNVQRELITAAGDIAENLLKHYDNEISNIFLGQLFKHLESKYRLNIDLRASQLAKISAILMSHFSGVIAEMREIEQRRQWLLSNYSALVETTKDEFNWGSAARSLGAGALAVANPFIGIPALIVNFASQSSKGKAESAQVDRYSEQFAEFENKIYFLHQQILQAGEKTKTYICDKAHEVAVVAVLEVLKEITTNGHPIDHYIKSLDYAKLEKSERNVFGGNDNPPKS